MFEEKQILHVSCGMNHMAAIDRKGTLYTQGHGDLGQLGHGDDKKRTVFMPVLALKERRVIDVSCGEKFTVVIT